MANKYYCRIKGLDDDSWVEYEEEDHIKSASEYAKDVSRHVTELNPESYVKDLTVEVLDPEAEQGWMIEIDMIHIRRV